MSLDTWINSWNNIEFYWKDTPVLRAIKVFFETFQVGIKDFVVFVYEPKSDDSQKVLSLLKENPNKKIIVINFNRGNFSGDTYYADIINNPNTRVVTSVFDFMVDMIKAINDLKEPEEARMDWEYRLDLAQISYSSQLMWILKHDLKLGVVEEKWSTYRRIIERARDLFRIPSRVSDQSVADFILSSKTKVEKVFEWKISWVYCDIDDTILRSDWTVIKSTLKIIKKLESEWHEIHIWTWWDLEIAKEKLTDTEFEKYTLLSKHNYAWAEAEIIIDNVSPEKFAIQSWITAKRYIRINIED